MRRLKHFIWLMLCVLALMDTAQGATYSSAATTFNWITPAAPTTAVWTNGASCTSGYDGAPVDDDITVQLPLGFTFNFGGVNYTTVQIMSNGRLQFGNGFCGAGTNAPGPQVPRTYPYPYADAGLLRTMKVYGADIDLTAGGSVTYAATGTTPNRQFVVTWINAREWDAGNGSGANSSFNLQVILKENGDFVFQYGASNNTSHGNAQIGWELTTTDYALIAYPPDTSTTPGTSSSSVGIGTLTNTAIRFFIPAMLANYQLDEGAWSGANSVINSASTGFNGTPAGAVTSTASGYQCRGASIPLNTAKATIDGIDTGIAVAANMGNAGAVDFWYNPRTTWNDGVDRMLLDATANNSAPFFLIKRTDGSLRFVLQDSSNNVFATVGGTHNFAANTWHHIAITWSMGASARMIIYLDGSVDKQYNLVTSSALANLIGTLFLGDSQGKAVSNNPTDNSANGIIDEVRVYNYEIPSTVVNRDRNANHSCSTLNNFLINVGAASASTCTPKNIQITARDASNATLTGYASSINLSTTSTAGAHGDWTKVTANGTLAAGAADSGAATYGFVAADSGTITLVLSDSHADNLTVTVSDAGAGVSATSSTINFLDNVFVISPTDALGTTLVANRSHGFKADMYRKDSSSGTCSIAAGYIGNKPLKAWLTRDVSDPGGAAPSINGMALPNVQPVGTNLTLSFNSGTANFSVVTSDVGKYTFSLLDDTHGFASGVNILGASNTLTTRPFGLAFTNIKRGATNNPGGAGPTSAIFSAAGVAFQATVGGYLWDGADDLNNDGIPDAGADITNNGLAPKFAWPVTLSQTLNTPSGGTTGALGGTSNIPSASFTTGNGATTVNDLTYGEVGSMTLSANARNFLNTSGVNLSATSGVIGRFTPDHFDVSYNTPTFTPGCATGNFTYLAQPFMYSAGQQPVMTVSARSAPVGGAITKNYTGSFWKITTSTLTGRTYTPATGTLDTANLPATSSDPAIVDSGAGSGTLTFSINSPGLSFQRGALVAPFNADISLGINIIDADGVIFAGNPAAFGAATAGNGMAFTCTGAGCNGKEMRFGRLNLRDAYGSELLPLPINLNAEYWAGNTTGFVANSNDDLCTGIAASQVTLTPHSPLIAGDTTLTVAANPLVAGSWHKAVNGPYSQLSKPASGNAGSVDLSVNLDAAGVPWLKYNWDGIDQGADGNLWDDNPSARAVFGIYRGPDRRIYLRERFN